MNRRHANASGDRNLQSRRLRFQPLEYRQMLSIIADGFADSFVQAWRNTGDEYMVVSELRFNRR